MRCNLCDQRIPPTSPADVKSNPKKKIRANHPTSIPERVGEDDWLSTGRYPGPGTYLVVKNRKYRTGHGWVIDGRDFNTPNFKNNKLFPLCDQKSFATFCCLLCVWPTGKFRDSPAIRIHYFKLAVAGGVIYVAGANPQIEISQHTYWLPSMPGL